MFSKRNNKSLSDITWYTIKVNNCYLHTSFNTKALLSIEEEGFGVKKIFFNKTYFIENNRLEIYITSFIIILYVGMVFKIIF